MAINLPRLIDEYFIQLLVSDRNSDRADKHAPQYTEEEFDTNGIQRNWGGNVGFDKNSTGESGHNV